MTHHYLAAFHMLDAYDEGYKWECQCEHCHAVRNDPALEAAMQKALVSKPPKPKGKPTPIQIINLSDE